MSNEIIQTASLKKQAGVSMLVICALFGAYAIWEMVSPPSMTAHCAYLIEKYPPEDFSFIGTSAREETMKCLYNKWRYNQKTWKVNENYIVR